MNKLLVIALGLAVCVVIAFVVYINFFLQTGTIVNTSSKVKDYSLKTQDSAALEGYIGNLSYQDFENINIILSSEEKRKYPIYENNDPQGKVMAGYDYKMDGKKLSIYLYFAPEYLQELKEGDVFSQFDQPTFYTLFALEQVDADLKGVPLQIDQVVDRVNRTVKSMATYPIVIE